jgi:hypothetical protein
MITDLLDDLPVWAFLALFAVITLLCYEIGFRVGRWWQEREPGEQEGPTDTMVGALLGLMAFLLAVTMGMAADRFDTRRGMVLEDANAIRAAYLQADYLPVADATALQKLLREYAEVRVATADAGQVQAAIARSEQLHGEMWAIVARVAESGYSPDLMSSQGDTVTELITVHERRLVSGLYARVPDTVLVLLIIGSALSLAVVGYSAGLKGKRGVVVAVVLVVALGVVLSLVVDLDRPQDGMVRVSQQPLYDVQRQIGPPAGP